MSIHQISVFLENRSGQLAEITRLLASENVDIRAISIAETSDYGLARMIVDDAQKASSILLQSGTILSMTPVWAVEVPDRPAGLSELPHPPHAGRIFLHRQISREHHLSDSASADVPK